MNNSAMNLNRTEFGDPQNSGNVISENEAFELLHFWLDYSMTRTGKSGPKRIVIKLWRN